ncbi:MAG: DUF2812 domain-containing protein [Lachnospiraceae bacterium]|nr:DUF2812 domain-containing protein [Lachnospiraceae bacterium]
MGEYKYQLASFALFDYKGVETHLEKMAAKGWRFDQIGSFAWRFRKAEPARVKYSVTYVPEASEFDPEPLEKQKEMEEYCEAAGREKAGSWMQMQIFCSETPEAVPIETDELLRLEIIKKSMKKNFLFSHLLLLLVFLMNAFTQFQIASGNWLEFLADSSRLWNFAIWFLGIFYLLFDVAYYWNWLKKAEKEAKEGRACPAPRLYRTLSRIFLGILAAVVLGLFCSYNRNMVLFMMIYLIGIVLIILLLRKVQKTLKKQGMSKTGNWILTIVADVVLVVSLLGGLTAVVLKSGIHLDGEKEPVSVYEVLGREWKVYNEEIPLRIEDFMAAEYEASSCEAEETSSILLRLGEYNQKLFTDSVVLGMQYEVITVKVKCLYDFCLNAFFEKEFRHSSREEREKTEFRVVYETEQAKFHRVYYDGVPMAHDWLLLTENKIIPMTLYLEDLTEEQMEKIIKKFSD